jgi:hypothetical protein
MKWRCVLFQRWLPDYPDGELSAFWRRRLEAHLQVCAGCRQEWAGLQEAEFWEAFNRELHQKLARLNHETPAPEPRRFKLPYLLGAPALAVLLIFLSNYLVNLHLPGKAPLQLAEPQKVETPAQSKPVELAKEKRPAPAPAAPEKARFREAEVGLAATGMPAANQTAASEQFLYAGFDDALWEEEDFPTWDMDSVLADLSRQEREALAERLSAGRK